MCAGNCGCNGKCGTACKCLLKELNDRNKERGRAKSSKPSVANKKQ